MTGISYTAAIVLAAVFAWAAVAKLRSVGATTAGFAGLGLPAPGVMARVVPVAELGLAGLLTARPAWGGITALALLALFTAVLVVNVGRAGQGCNCFGASPSDDDGVSGIEVVRNLLLAAAAVVATGVPRPVVPALPDVIVTTTVGLLAAVGLGMLQLRHRVGRVWDNRLPGEPAPR